MAISCRGLVTGLGERDRGDGQEYQHEATEHHDRGNRGNCLQQQTHGGLEGIANSRSRHHATCNGHRASGIGMETRTMLAVTSTNPTARIMSPTGICVVRAQREEIIWKIAAAAKTENATEPATTCEVMPNFPEINTGANDVKKPNMANPTKAIMVAAR